MGRAVPKEAQKAFNNGRFSGTDINPMWRIKKLTELFGPVGKGWYVDNVQERAEIHGETTVTIVTLNLYVNYGGEWSKPIYGTGGNTIAAKGRVSDEGYKMAYTDALSVACKALGIGADVYWSADNQTKYQSATPAAAAKAAEPAADDIKAAREAMTLDNIKSREQFEAAYKAGRSLGLDKDKDYKAAAMVVAAQYPKTA